MRTRTVFFAVLAILLMFSGCSKAENQSKAAKDIEADFTLELIDGEKIVLSDILKDREAILVFWTTWCHYCKTELVRIERFYRENKDKVEVIAIVIEESKAKVGNFVRKIGVSYPIALDYEGSVARLYNVLGVPTIVALNKDGKIVYYGHSVEEMMDKIDF